MSVGAAPQEAPPALKFESVFFRYNSHDLPLLEGLSFSIQYGQSLCLWGPSGSGKSTVLALAAGLLKPSRGEIQRPTSRVAWIMQTSNVIGSMSALDNVALGAVLSGAALPEARITASALLKDLDLDGFASTRAKHLSGGQSQRVAIARAVAMDAPLLFADEPTGQLDSLATAKACDVLLPPRGQATVIVASHDRHLAERCDLIVDLGDRDGSR